MRGVIVAAGLAVGLLVSACSSSSEPVEPTATTTPQATPTASLARTPSPTATPTNAPDDTAYALQVIASMTTTEKLWDDFRKAVREPDFASTSWRAEVIEIIDAIQTEARIMISAEAPLPKWDAFNKEWTAAGEEFQEAMILLRSGVNNASAATINDATAKVIAGWERLEEALPLIPEWGN